MLRLLLMAAAAASAQTPAFIGEAELGAAVSGAGASVRAAMEERPRMVPLAAPLPRENIGGADVPALFAFAVKHGGYEEWCRSTPCQASAVILVEASENVRRDHSGWYNGGNSYVKDRPNPLSLEITTVHEQTHHLQRLSNRYQQYRGICNQFLAEKEAYEVGEAYARSKGFTTNYAPRLAPYEKKCRDAVAAGLVKAPPGLVLEPR